MSEYWKSQPKKFCDFCKCWITDNKASVDFHERGKRHNENVQKRISDIQKKSVAKEKKDAAFKSDLQAMEEAALKAFQQDVQRDPKLAGQYKNAVLQKKLQMQESEKPAEQSSTESHPKPEDILPYWVEGVSPEGYTYFWNSFTGESSWEKPEGFVSTADNQSLEQQQSEDQPSKQAEEQPSEEQTEKQPADQSTEKTEQEDKEETEDEGGGGGGSKSEDKPKETKDDNAADSTEKTNDQQTKSTSKKRSNPYGTWQAIEPVSSETPDLQLPDARASYIAPPVTIALEEPKIKIKFKEKTVGSIGGGSEKVNVGFKKRKIGNRNIKKREDES